MVHDESGEDSRVWDRKRLSSFAFFVLQGFMRSPLRADLDPYVELLPQCTFESEESSYGLRQVEGIVKPLLTEKTVTASRFP